MIRSGHKRLARSFNLCYIYIDDLIVFNNKKFLDYLKEIYPSQLTVEKANKSDHLADYLDLTFIIDSGGKLSTRLCDKRDDFDFHIVNFQSAFLNNFENIVNKRVNIQEDIKRYQDTLSYASSKVNYSIGENIYMIPSDMNLKIRSGTVRYNNKILVSDEKFILGKNEKVNSLEPAAMKSHKDSNHVNQTAVTHKDSETAVTHKDLEKKLTITHKENCFNSYFNWNIYDMVPVSIH